MKNTFRLRGWNIGPLELDELRRELEVWRQAQPGRARLPTEVWERAAVLAGTHGVSRVSRTLRLSFAKLRRWARTRSPGPRVPAAPAEFIELAPPAGAVSGEGACVVELFDGDRRRMTVQFSSGSRAVLELAEAFWRRSR